MKNLEPFLVKLDLHLPLLAELIHVPLEINTMFYNWFILWFYPYAISLFMYSLSASTSLGL